MRKIHADASNMMLGEFTSIIIPFLLVPCGRLGRQLFIRLNMAKRFLPTWSSSIDARIVFYGVIAVVRPGCLF